MHNKIYLAIAALAFGACLAVSGPAKADWGHHHHEGYWHNGIWIDLGEPGYYYPPAPAYYYPPPQQVYYAPPPQVYYPPVYNAYPPYGYYNAPAYFMGVPLNGLGLGVNVRIH